MTKKLSMNQNTKNRGNNDVDLSKRRLGKLGVLATPVLLSVVGRPAWGGNCSPSAVLSHTHASHHPEPVNCKFGCSPGYWMKSNHNWSGLTAYYKEQNFCEVFGIFDCSAHPYNGMSLIQAMRMIKDRTIDQNLRIATFHAIAGILNASAHQADGGYLGYSSLDIIAAYNTAYGAFANVSSHVLSSSEGLIKLIDFLNQYPDGTVEDVVCMFNREGRVEAPYWNNRTRAFDF